MPGPKLRVAIVDDEGHARAAIRILLERRGGVDVVAECRNGAEAVEVLQWVTVDLLLLDIQMPGLDGFGVLKALGADKVPPTIFVTAFDEYAIRAFDVEAVDYVLKPFDEARFLAAFERARLRIDERRAAKWARRFLASAPDDPNVAPAQPLPRLPVSVGDRILFLSFDEIDWIQAADPYVVVHVGAKEYLMRESLRHLSTRLPRDQFARIHRSHAVNLAKVREITRLGKGDAEVTLTGGLRLRCSRRYRRGLSMPS